MTRLLAGFAVLVAAATVALPASAKDGRSATGVLALATSTSVTVQTAKSSVQCSLTRKSPSLAGYSIGDRVRVECARGGRRLVLAHIRHVVAKTSAGSNDSSTPVKFGGAVTALSDTSITVHDGDRDLTCTIDGTSPSTDGLKVGAHVNVACANGILVAWAPVSTSGGGRAYTGKISSITDTGVSVLYAGGTATCTLTPTSPSIAGFAVGDYVLMGCTRDTGQLLLLKHATDGGGTGSGSGGSGSGDGAGSANQTTKGTITALTDGSVTVHNVEHGDLTCTRGDSSPSLSGFQIGQVVGMACKDNILVLIVGAGSPPPPPPPPPPNVNQTTGGTITAVGDGSITVHNTEHGDLTCTTGDGSPSLDGFHVGDTVGMGCKDNVLVVLAHR
jgi:hypothetical protein